MSDSTLNTGLNAGLDAGSSKGFFGHPRGLAYIVFTEAWERFSFYGMQALLVLYMAGYLLHPGTVEHVIGFAGFRSVIESVFGSLSPQAFASQVFGLYVGLVFFMPVLGGLLGDRLIGRRRAVVSGALLMALGHFLMALEAAFLFALLALILGSGLLKGNLAAQVGNLYTRSDPRRDAAFSIYCLGINLGAFVAPLVCGTLGELYGWHYGFAAAGIGMLLSISIYLAGSRYLPPETKPGAKAAAQRLQPGEGKAVVALLVVLAFTSLYWVAQTQVWNTYALWVRDRVDRGLFGVAIPVTWFQSIDFVAVVALAPFILWFWRRQAARGTEPDDLTKITIGCGVFVVSCAWLAAAEVLSAGHSVALIWPLAFHVIGAFAYLYAGPIVLGLVSRSAPASVNAMMVGAYYLSIFVGGVGSGWLGRFYEKLTPQGFWLLHAAIAAAGPVLLLAFRRPLRRALKLDTEHVPPIATSIQSVASRLD